MKRTWKQIGSLFMVLCMVLTMLPMTAFAETGDVDSGTPLGTSGTITAFAELDENITAQVVETGTPEKKLNLPDTLAVTVTESSDETATDSDAWKETQTTVKVESWTSAPDYDGDTEGDYVFTPALDLPEGITLAEGVTPSAITVTVAVPAAPALRGAVQLMTGPGGITCLDVAIGESDLDATQDQSGTGWDWDADTNTFTLSGDITGNIIFRIGTGDVNFVVSGSPTFTGFIQQNVGKLTISGGTLNVNNSFNDYSALFAASGLEIDGATVNISTSSSYAGGVYVGSGDLTMSSGSLTVTTTGDSSNGIYLGDGGNLIVSNGTVTVTGNVQGNLTVSGGAVTVTGAVSGTTTHTGGTLNGNPPTSGSETITYPGADLQTDPLSTYYQSLLPTTSTSNNIVTVSGGTIDGAVYGGFDHLGRNGSSGDANVVGNTVTINDGTITGTANAAISGGRAYSGAASNNTVTINGGTISGFKAMRGGESMMGDVKNNQIIITGGTIEAQIMGGLSGADTSENNSVSIREGGALNLTESTIVGVSATDALNIERAGVTVMGIWLFKNYNFKLPASIANGSVMLTTTNGEGDGSPVDIDGVTIGISVAGAPSLAVGSKITLIDSTAKGLTGTPTTTTITDATGYTFNIAVEEGKLTATVTNAPAVITTHTVTFNLNGGTRTGGGELSQTIAEGGAATAPIVTRNGYTFTGWDKAFTNVTSNLTVTASWSDNGDGGGSTGGSSGGTTNPTTTPPENKPDQPVTAAAPVTATAGKNGTASAAIPDKSIADAIAKAQADAKAQGKTASGISVGLNVTMPQGATALTATLTQNSLNSLVSAGVSQLALDGAPISLGLDLNALKEIQKQSGGNISITIAPATGLSNEAKTILGNRPVYNINISAVKDGKPTHVSSLGGGTATLSIPYTPSKNEAVGYLFGVYVDANGKAQRIDGSAYDANSGSLLIPTGHFSVYGVGYTAPSAKFTDIGTHWGKEAIDYVVGRGLLSGTSDTTFAPNTAMTRGMLVTALGRLAGVDAKAFVSNSFTDVKADSAFRPYIEWAYKKGIIQGIGNQQFAPDRAITREEIAVIIANYANATGYKLPVIREATAYADASSIGSVYQTAVTAMQQAGIMMGGTGNKFNPKSNATRAEVSSMLHRYIKLTIDPATAQGWAKNDVGQYLYYKDGKALTGTQTIDGVKYFFETTGVLKTGWVQDGNNWRFYSGNIMLVGFWDLGANGNNKTYYFDTYGNMVSGKWLQIDGKWYYFNADGSLAKSTKIDGYEVDESGVRKTK